VRVGVVLTGDVGVWDGGEWRFGRRRRSAGFKTCASNGFKIRSRVLWRQHVKFGKRADALLAAAPASRANGGC